MNEFGDQIYNIDGSRRTIRRRRDNYNTQSRSHTVRSYATNVKEDKEIRTTSRTKEMKDSIAEIEMEVARSNLEEITMTNLLEATKRNLNYPVLVIISVLVLISFLVLISVLVLIQSWF